MPSQELCRLAGKPPFSHSIRHACAGDRRHHVPWSVCTGPQQASLKPTPSRSAFAERVYNQQTTLWYLVPCTHTLDTSTACLPYNASKSRNTWFGWWERTGYDDVSTVASSVPPRISEESVHQFGGADQKKCIHCPLCLRQQEVRNRERRWPFRNDSISRPFQAGGSRKGWVGIGRSQ